MPRCRARGPGDAGNVGKCGRSNRACGYGWRMARNKSDRLLECSTALVSASLCRVVSCASTQREAAEGESKNNSEAKKRVAEYESAARMAEATYKADAHVQASMQGTKGRGREMTPREWGDRVTRRAGRDDCDRGRIFVGVGVRLAVHPRRWIPMTSVDNKSRGQR